MADGAGSLRRHVLAAYALPGLPLAALTLPVYIYLPAYYGADLGLGLALTGSVLLFARLFDVVTDPLAGWWSDRVGLRLGRRRVWVLAASPLVMLSIWKLFMPEPPVDAAYLLVWTLALYLGWTAMLLPYQAWGAELSGDYHERSRIVGAREACVVIGTCIAAGMPALSQALAGEQAAADKGVALAWTGWFSLAALPLTLFLLLLLVPEPRPVQSRGVSFRQGLRVMARNGPFRRLIAAYLLNGTANGLTATLFLLFVEHRLDAPAESGVLLLTYFLAGILSVPLWLWVSHRIGKHRAWTVGLLAACLGFLTVPFLGAGDVAAFYAVCIATGLCLGADLALPGAMQADVVDYDTVRTGSQRTGFYFAAWSMATKLALALAVGIAFPLLAASGFEAGGANGPVPLLALSLLYGVLPIPIKLAAIALVWRFPIDQARQARLRRLIDRRQARAVAPAT